MKLLSGNLPSKKYQLSTEDLKKIGIGALIALGGALLTYLTDLIPNVDFGVWTPFVVSGFGVLINLARKFLQDLETNS